MENIRKHVHICKLKFESRCPKAWALRLMLDQGNLGIEARSWCPIKGTSYGVIPFFIQVHGMAVLDRLPCP